MAANTTNNCCHLLQLQSDPKHGASSNKLTVAASLLLSIIVCVCKVNKYTCLMLLTTMWAVSLYKGK